MPLRPFLGCAHCLCIKSLKVFALCMLVGASQPLPNLRKFRPEVSFQKISLSLLQTKKMRSSRWLKRLPKVPKLHCQRASLSQTKTALKDVTFVSNGGPTEQNTGQILLCLFQNLKSYLGQKYQRKSCKPHILRTPNLYFLGTTGLQERQSCSRKMLYVSIIQQARMGRFSHIALTTPQPMKSRSRTC